MKRMYWVFITLLVLSCNNKTNEHQKLASTLIDQNNESPEGFTPQQEVSDSTGGANTAEIPPAAPEKTDWTKKIIKTADLALELKDYSSFNNTVHQSLGSYGAYIAQEQQVQSDEQVSNTMIIKVPIDKFEPLVNFLTANKSNKLLQKQISSSDVTSEYVDTRSRVETKKQVRAKYYELLKQARKMDEVLQVQSEINSITEDIEAASGRIQYLAHETSYSTINIQYYQVLDASKANETSPGFFTRFASAFNNGISLIGDLILLLVYIWPLLLVLVFAWWWIKRKPAGEKPAA